MQRLQCGACLACDLVADHVAGTSSWNSVTPLEPPLKISPRLISSTLLLGIAISGPWATAEAQANSDLHGGWVITSWAAAEGQTGPTPQRGLFLFTESGHYSIMFVIGEAREALGANPSDGNIAAAYNPFVANAGRYTVSENQITYEAAVAKDPAYMSRFKGAPDAPGGEGNAQTITFSIDDGTLTLSFGEGGPMQGATATLRRPGTG